MALRFAVCSDGWFQGDRAYADKSASCGLSGLLAQAAVLVRYDFVGSYEQV